MPELQLWWWERYAPSLGDNRKLEKPFTLKVKAGLPKARWSKFLEFLGGEPRFADVDGFAAELADLVELGEEPLAIAGKTVANMHDYLEAVLLSPIAGELVRELIGALTWHNTVEGMRAHFSERPFGTTVGTPGAAPRAQTAASPQPSGNETKH